MGGCVHRKMELATGTDIRDAQMFPLLHTLGTLYGDMMRFASINQKVSALAEARNSCHAAIMTEITTVCHARVPLTATAFRLPADNEVQLFPCCYFEY